MRRPGRRSRPRVPDYFHLFRGVRSRRRRVAQWPPGDNPLALHRRLVVSPHRDGGQAQQVLRPVARSRESLRLGQLFDYLHQHLAASHTVASLAQRAGMGTRTFLRRFEEATGKTPARWLLEERLLRARQHLTESTMGIDQIAERCGFASAGTLRHHFRQRFALSPLQYRKQFATSPIAKSSQPRTIDGHSKPVARMVDDEERVSGSNL